MRLTCTKALVEDHTLLQCDAVCYCDAAKIHACPAEMQCAYTVIRCVFLPAYYLLLYLLMCLSFPLTHTLTFCYCTQVCFSLGLQYIFSFLKCVWTPVSVCDRFLSVSPLEQRNEVASAHTHTVVSSGQGGTRRDKELSY